MLACNIIKLRLLQYKCFPITFARISIETFYWTRVNDCSWATSIKFSDILRNAFGYAFQNTFESYICLTASFINKYQYHKTILLQFVIKNYYSNLLKLWNLKIQNTLALVTYLTIDLTTYVLCGWKKERFNFTVMTNVFNDLRIHVFSTATTKKYRSFELLNIKFCVCKIHIFHQNNIRIVLCWWRLRIT